MHDLDRTQLEFDHTGDFEADELTDEAGLFSESEEMELASELLSVSNEEELDYFLGKLLKKAGRAFGRVLRTPEFRAIGGLLRGIAKKALPIAGAAVGNLVAPGVGGALGGATASHLGNVFGLELEGLSMEDQEFEAARRIVRLTGDAAQAAASAPPGNPEATARAAIQQAARIHAPGIAGLMSRRAAARRPSCNCSVASGRWVRRGKQIVLIGL